MKKAQHLRACLWLRASSDTKAQDPTSHKADLEIVCHQQGWEIVSIYQVEESTFGETLCERFRETLEDARKGKFDVLVVWSMDRFSRDGKSFLVFMEDGSLVTLDTDPDAWRSSICARAGRNFTQAEWQEYFPGEAYRKTCEQWPLEGE